MKLVIFTIVLDGMPFIQWHLPIFQKLKCDWKWIVVEGTAQNKCSTKWCQPQKERHSNDGTLEYLESIKDDRISVHKGRWQSKDGMVEFATMGIKESCILMQIDADEIYKPETIDKIVQLFEKDNELWEICMPCRFFVGKNLICVGENCWSNREFEWARAWRFQPGDRFKSHEPPILEPRRGYTYWRKESQNHGLTFDHYAYALKKQVEYKEQFYGYKGLTNQWMALQKCDVFPQQLNRFFPFVDDRVIVDRLGSPRNGPACQGSARQGLASQK